MVKISKKCLASFYIVFACLTILLCSLPAYTLSSILERACIGVNSDPDKTELESDLISFLISKPDAEGNRDALLKYNMSVENLIFQVENPRHISRACYKKGLDTECDIDREKFILQKASFVLRLDGKIFNCY